MSEDARALSTMRFATDTRQFSLTVQKTKYKMSAESEASNSAIF